MEQQTFDLLLLTMSALAVVVFAALYYVRAGYGMFQTSKWGISLNNKLGWILMEAPVFSSCSIYGGIAVCVVALCLLSFSYSLNCIISSVPLYSLS